MLKMGWEKTGFKILFGLQRGHHHTHERDCNEETHCGENKAANCAASWLSCSLGIFDY